MKEISMSSVISKMSIPITGFNSTIIQVYHGQPDNHSNNNNKEALKRKV